MAPVVRDKLGEGMSNDWTALTAPGAVHTCHPERVHHYRLSRRQPSNQQSRRHSKQDRGTATCNESRRGLPNASSRERDDQPRQRNIAGSSNQTLDATSSAGLVPAHSDMFVAGRFRAVPTRGYRRRRGALTPDISVSLWAFQSALAPFSTSLPVSGALTK
jgi:hypothetical protein